MKGLKQAVEQALGSELVIDVPPPVEVSDEALFALSKMMREWSGWPDSTVKFGDPRPVSPYASCDHNTRTFTANADLLILNPNRVLLTVTPFRLKQEAVLTGCLLHEAGHARHSHWRPRKEEDIPAFVHGAGSTHEGEPVNMQTLNLAMLLEEPRVEGLMARNAERVGASGLGWTMRASGAHLAPFTNLSTDPGQRVMDLITSWTLRAGKQIAVAHWTTYNLPQWVQDLTSLLHGVLVEHLTNVGDDNPQRTGQKVIDQLILMAVCVEDRGTYMVDSARDICDWLFPETDGDDESAPQPGQGCTAQPGDSGEESESESGDNGEGDEEGQDGEGNTEPEDPGEGEDPGTGDKGNDEDEDAPADDAESSTEEDESDEEGKPEVSDDPDTDKPADEADDQPSQKSDPGGTQDGQPAEVDTESELAQALRGLEESSKDQTEGEAEDLADQQGGDSGGNGDGPGAGEGFRLPSKEDRVIQAGAEKFLRSLIEPTEYSRVSLTDTPSSSIDGSTYEAWRTGGKIRAPHFFRQTRRSVEPSPPVRIGILVDVSISMDELSRPAALLSWSLASAALDLQNFAGRGQRIEACLIHWGGHARVVQEVGKHEPNIREWSSTEGTDSWPEAMELVEEQMPGFFEVPLSPVNRLVVNFTDWQFTTSSRDRGKRHFNRMLEAGVNMLSVVPKDYSQRSKWNALSEYLKGATVQRGKTSLIRFNPLYPGQVWDTAAEMLDDGTPAPFPGF